MQPGSREMVQNTAGLNDFVVALEDSLDHPTSCIRRQGLYGVIHYLPVGGTEFG